MPGQQPMPPVDFSGREAIRFLTWRDGRQDSGDVDQQGPQPAGSLSTVTSFIPEEWTQVDIRPEDVRRRRRKSQHYVNLRLLGLTDLHVT